ncbi:MAG: exodeoxyribonuclease V subunit alpha [Deltaproteobacteria bacterium]|nr:exodeoxyribonuclease V subunit alpha [Deltaproteobacteria bacterium]
MNKDYITNIYNKGLLTELDIYFAGFITDLCGNDDPDVFLGAALTSHVTGNGDVCLDLAAMAAKVLVEKQNGNEPIVCPQLSVWRDKLLAAPAVGRPGEFRPLVLDQKHRLYLYRYWDYEKRLSDSIKIRVQEDVRDIDVPLLERGIKRLFPEDKEKAANWQKVAGIVSILKRFCVISGGPGTGKTFTIARILALLIEQARGARLRIFLCAPTGKAAAKLKESIKNARDTLDCGEDVRKAIPNEVYTIHRMLRTIPGSPYFHHHSENLLPADIVVVDEASMVDLALMSKLVQAVPTDARLILVGDKDQLASVEAGSVLGDICGRDIIHGFSRDFFDKMTKIDGARLEIEGRKLGDRPGLIDCIVLLKKNYRFAEGSGIYGLSRSVNQGDADTAIKLLNPLKGDKSIEWGKFTLPNDLTRKFTKRILAWHSAYLKTDDPRKALELLNRFKILCALKKGPFGVEALNKVAERVLVQQGLISPGKQWYRGKPILIIRNDYHLGLFNGDLGIIMSVQGSGSEDLYAFFPGTSGELRRFLPQRIADHETAYAMTVHKSQGSEFEEVLLVLPDKNYPVLTRELIYTAITRARRKVSIWGPEKICITAIKQKIVRTSGLRDALWE